MKHLLRLLVFALCLLSSSHALRAQRAKYASLINALREAELFDEERRAQLTTLLEQDTVQTFPIALDSDTKLLEASKNGLRLQTSEIGTTEVRLLPASQGSIIALIETVSSPQVDALITFLSPSGTPLSSTCARSSTHSTVPSPGLQTPPHPRSLSAPRSFYPKRISRAMSSRLLLLSSPRSPRAGAVRPSLPSYALPIPKHL